MIEAVQREARFPDLRGKSVLVTGAGAGLGRSMALAFAGQGCRLALNDIDSEALAVTRQQVLELDAECVISGGSVTSQSDVERFISLATDSFSAIDVLVNNAGVSAVEPSAELPDAIWERALDINLTGPMRCARAVATLMCAAGCGAIINMSSIYGLVAAPQRAGYCATKSALAMLTKVLAVEWAQHGVRVNALAPSYVQSEFVDRLAAEGKLDLVAISQRTPIGRLVTQSEVANAALFLASDLASAITGQVLAVDGGWTAYGYV